MGLAGTDWELDFKQCSFHHIMQVLRVCRFSTFSLSPAFPPCYCPLAFQRQVRRLTYRISSESYPGIQGCVVSCHGADRFANSSPASSQSSNQGKMDIDLSYATIDGTLDLGQASLPSLDLTGTRIGRDLLLGNATWQPKAELQLYNTEVVGIQDLLEIRKEDLRQKSPAFLQLEGFTYSRLAALNTKTPIDPEALLAASVAWLQKHQPYSPQPYEQLASVMQKAGYKSVATAILYESQRRERREKASRWRLAWRRQTASWGSWAWLRHQTASGMQLVWLWAEQVVIGYGYYNFRVLRWAVGFCLVGWAVLCLSGDADKLSRPYDASPSGAYTTPRMRPEPRLLPDNELPLFLVNTTSPPRLLPHNELFLFLVDTTPHIRLESRLLPYDALPFTVGMLLPIIKLNKKHEDVIQHMTVWVRWYFYFHQIIGYVLASFLVAGLAGLTKKKE